MIPCWYKHFDIYEYFISDDGWCITSNSKEDIVIINKYTGLWRFKVVDSSYEKIISDKSKFLLMNLFTYGWGGDYNNIGYDGDFFK